MTHKMHSYGARVADNYEAMWVYDNYETMWVLGECISVTWL